MVSVYKSREEFPPATAWVAAEVQVQSLAQLSELKDLVLRLRFNFWPGNFHKLLVQSFKKKKREFLSWPGLPQWVKDLALP